MARNSANASSSPMRATWTMEIVLAAAVRRKWADTSVTNIEVCTSNMITLVLVVKPKCVDYDSACHLERDARMATDTECQALVKALLKAEMKRRNLTYDRLPEKPGEGRGPDPAR